MVPTPRVGKCIRLLTNSWCHFLSHVHSSLDFWSFCLAHARMLSLAFSLCLTHTYAQQGLLIKKWERKRTNNTPKNFKARKGGSAKSAEDTCQVCKSGDGEAEMILCDDCNQGFHTYCLNPQLSKVPEGNWFCQSCLSSRLGDFSAQISDMLVNEDFEAKEKQALLTKLLDKLKGHATCPAAIQLYSERKDEVRRKLVNFYDPKKGWFKKCPDTTHRLDYLQYVKVIELCISEYFRLNFY